MEYISIEENIGLINGFINVGVIRVEEEIILIDSGLEEEVQELSQILLNKNLRPALIINTHAHRDHCGGNNYIQKKYNVDILTSYKESIFIENPCLEAFCFYSGAKPLLEMKSVHPSQVTGLLHPGEKKEIKGVELFFPDLAGHSPGQIGVAIGDILFCGDAFFSDYVLERYKLPFLTDLDGFMATLEYLKGSDYRIYVPAHGKPVMEIEGLVDLHIDKFKKIEEDILTLLEEEKSIEELLQDLFSLYKINISGPEQYFQLKTTVMAYLSSLCNRKLIRTGLKGNILSWKVT